MGNNVFRKNLCFYLYPLKNSPTWVFHLNRLKSYWPLFNGKKVITVATDERTADVEELKETLGQKDVTWRVIKNDKQLWETAGFVGMLECVENLSPDEATFYCHGKGAGYMDVAKKRWVDAMYYLNLSSAKLIDNLLNQYDAVGAFQFRNTAHAGSDWHYSGTFFWLKHSAIFSKNWKDIEPTNYGVEGYPGRHIPVERSYSLIDPPNTRAFLEKWKPIIPDMGPVEGWTPEIAELRYSQIKKGIFPYMKKLFSDAGVEEEPRTDIVFLDCIFASEIMSAVSREECRKLADLAAGKCVIELGSQFGRSTVALASAASKVHAVDWHLGDGHAGVQDSLPGFMKNLSRYQFRRNVAVHVGRHEDILPFLAPRSFDFAFIDSFHEGPDVRRDIGLVLPLMKPNGTIAFHDYGTTFPGVTGVVQEFARSRGASIENTVGSLAIVRMGNTMKARVCCTGEFLERKLTRFDLQWIIDRYIEKNPNNPIPTHSEAKWLQPYCKGLTLDIGCGAEKVLPNILGIDKLGYGERGESGCMNGSSSAADISADASDLSFIPDETVDTVVSRHCFEHLIDSRETLREWLRIIKKGGRLAMVSPHDGFGADFLNMDKDHKFRCYPESVDIALKYLNARGGVQGRMVENGRMVTAGWSFFSLIERL